MSNNAQKIGWIGAGRMGTPMAERLLKAGHDVSIWNRTRAKAEPLAAKGGKMVDKPVRPGRLRRRVRHRLHRQGRRGGHVRQGRRLLSASKLPKMRGRLLVDLGRGLRRHPQAAEGERRRVHVAAPVSGNAKVIKAGKLSSVVSGPEADCQGRDAADRSVRAARRLLRRRRRTRAHLQDRAQRHARRGDREPDRDHAARPTRWACRATPSSPS